MMPPFFRKTLAILAVGSIAFASIASENPNIEETKTWVIRTTGASISKKALLRANAEDQGEIEALEGFYLISFEHSNLSNKEIEAYLDSLDTVLWYEQQIKDQRSKPHAIPGDPTNEPLWGNAWHIANSGAKNGRRGEDLNLLPTWDTGFDGTGVIVAVIDQGTELDHPDLEGNIRKDLALDLIDSGSNAHKLDTDESHGTAVSGIIAATDNDIGSVGVAYGAHLVPIRYIGKAHRDGDVAKVMGYRRDIISIYNNSWGPSLGEDENGDSLGIGMIKPRRLGKGAVQQGVLRGRNGLGSIYVFAAGNDADDGSNVNYNGWANMRETIAVGAIGNKGKYAAYSEPGAPVLISAPSGGQSLGIVTTDLVGTNGDETTDYTTSFSGTSAATPMVSGVIALMLDANPLLNWRDVQHILVHSAIQADPKDESWKINGAGLPYSDRYGFGRLDASSAIQSAMAWTSVGNETSSTTSRTVNSFIPDNNGQAVTSSVNISRNIKIEHVYVEAEIRHPNWGNLQLTLTSPSGTVSVLATPHEDTTKSYSDWVYTSAQFWDEKSPGTWTLRTQDLVTGESGTLRNWKLTIYGSNIIQNANLAPIAKPDNYNGNIYPAIIPVLANDSDPNGDLLQIISLYSSEFGDVTINENQDLVYTPNEEFIGLDEFGYTISDANGLVADTQVNVTHPGPVSMPDQVVTAMNTSVKIPVLDNDFDRSGDPIELLSIEAPTEGSAIIESDHVIYTPTKEFVGHESFQYSITDNVDGQHTGTIHAFTSSSSDFAMLFDGKNDYIKVPAAQNLNLSNAITVETRVYLRSYGESSTVGFGRIVDRDNFLLFPNGESHQDYNDHSLVFALDLAGKGLLTANSPADTIQLNKWHTISVTYDGNQVSMFIDGEEVSVNYHEEVPGHATPGGDMASIPDAPLYIGEQHDQPTAARAFNGIIDWLRIWNVVRTETQQANSKTFVEEHDRNGLVSWWQFLRGTGSEAIDSIGGNHGVISEAKWGPLDPSLMPQLLEM